MREIDAFKKLSPKRLAGLDDRQKLALLYQHITPVLIYRAGIWPPVGTILKAIDSCQTAIVAHLLRTVRHRGEADDEFFRRRNHQASVAIRNFRGR